ncbi:MAG: NAD(P)-dependent oxidoreductase, partial [Fulvivirga sp.]
KRILICNVPGYSTASVAQHTFALLLELTNHVGRNARSTARGKWNESKDFCYTEAPIAELAGKVIGLVGLGNIGRQVACIANAFDMKVIYFNPSKKDTGLAEATSLKAIFEQSDVVSLHCPLKDDNAGFLNMDLLKKMKTSALLINTARGNLINEEDLAGALNQGIIAGAGLDVLSKEPPLAANPLLQAKNCIITPHTSWMSKEARQRVMTITAENIQGFLNEEPVGVVNLSSNR